MKSESILDQGYTSLNESKLKQLKWLGNIYLQDWKRLKQRLEACHKNRVLIISKPYRKEGDDSLDNFRFFNVVGIYELQSCDGCIICDNIKEYNLNEFLVLLSDTYKNSTEGR